MKDFITFMSICAVVIGLITGIGVFSAYLVENSEINTEQYDNVVLRVKNQPQLKDLFSEMTKDTIITNKEYQKLLSQYKINKATKGESL